MKSGTTIWNGNKILNTRYYNNLHMDVNDVTGFMYTGLGIGALGIGLGMLSNLTKQVSGQGTVKKTKYCDICKKKVKTPHSHESDYGGQLFSADNWKAENKSTKRHPAWLSTKKGGY
jgi:hypothetical protein